MVDLDSTEQIITLDSRRRVSLSGLGDPSVRYYLVRAESDGTIILTPAVIMSVNEARKLGDGGTSRPGGTTEAGGGDQPDGPT